MPLFLTTPKGAALTAYSQAEYDDMIASGKNPLSFEAAPQAVLDSIGMKESLYAFRTPFAAAGGGVWANHWGQPGGNWLVKPGFYEIFTGGMGPLTGMEVREVEKRLGIAIDDSTAVRTYNTKLDKDHSLYSEDLSQEELSTILEPAALDRLEAVHDWVSAMLEAEPIYFGFQTDKVLAEAIWMVEGIPHATILDVGKVPTIGVAFPGPHSQVRDVFNLTQFLGGGPNPKAMGLKAVALPGRDRPYRITGVNAFDVYLWNPALVLAQMQVEQILQGIPVTMERAPYVPRELWSWDIDPKLI